jgi:hypothetical protein
VRTGLARPEHKPFEGDCDARTSPGAGGWCDASEVPARASDFGGPVMEDVRIVECGLADAEELVEIGRETFLNASRHLTGDMREFPREGYRRETIHASSRRPGRATSSPALGMLRPAT